MKTNIEIKEKIKEINKLMDEHKCDKYFKNRFAAMLEILEWLDIDSFDENMYINQYERVVAQNKLLQQENILLKNKLKVSIDESIEKLKGIKNLILKELKMEGKND